MSSVTETTGNTNEAVVQKQSSMSAYVELTKPRISFMVLITVVVAALLNTPVWPGIVPLMLAGVAISLVAASGNAFNMYFERYTDFLMPRTATRPLPANRLTATQVATFGAVTLGIGVAFMITMLNVQTTICGLATWVLYVFVYTPLKTRTHYNTEVGAVAGAMPILMGCLAVSGFISPIGWFFFAVLFCWQFPHFMAIAWMYREQYQSGGLKMLTVVEPTGVAAGRKAIAYSVANWLASLLPIITFGSVWLSVVFGVLATVLSFYYFKASRQFAAERNRQTAVKLLKVSVTYLPGYMLLLVVASLISWNLS